MMEAAKNGAAGKSGGAGRAVVRLSPAAEKAVRALAKREGCTIGEAADHLIDVGLRRLKALKKWNAAQVEEAPAPAKKAACSSDEEE